MGPLTNSGDPGRTRDPAAPELRIESPALELSGVKHRRVAWQLVLAIASVLVVSIASAAEALSFPVILVAAILWMVGPGRALVEPAWKRPFRWKSGSLTRWNDALVLRAGDKQEILRAVQITDVKLRPLENKLEIVLDTAKIATVTTPDFSSVAPLLDAAGIPPQKRTHVAKLGRDANASKIPWIVSVVAAAALGLGLTLGADSPAMALWVVPLIASIAYFFSQIFASPGELSLGASGLTLAQPGDRRFFHYGGIRDIRMDPSRLRIFTDNGQEVSAKIEGLDTSARDRIEGWVQERRQAFASASAGTDAFAVLDRRGQSLDAWRAALKTILSQEGQYRRAPISADDLARLLTNPHTPAERRIAAAFILSENQSTMTHKQIRFAAESSSSQPMRIALRAIAEEKLETDAIEEALAAETGSGAR